MIKRTVAATSDVRRTPENVARMFCVMNADDQAVFFSEIARLQSDLTNVFILQLQAISESEELSESGLRIMQMIGEYSELG